MERCLACEADTWKVARHDPSHRDGVIRCSRFCPRPETLKRPADQSYRTLRDGLLGVGVQAFHARLPSFPRGHEDAQIQISFGRTLASLPITKGLILTDRLSIFLDS